MSIKVEGMGRVRAALLRVTGEAQRTASREVVRSALNIQTGAKQRVPVDTGRLRNSIAVAEDEGGIFETETVRASGRSSIRGQNQIRAGMLSAVVGTNVEYARPVEFGTRRAAAKPYLFPAAEEERPQFHARIRRELGVAFTRAVD